MSKEDDEKTQELIRSKQLLINDRFLVKLSVMNTGVYRNTVLLVVKDLVESNFKLKFYDSEDDAVTFIEALRRI